MRKGKKSRNKNLLIFVSLIILATSIGTFSYLNAYKNTAENIVSQQTEKVNYPTQYSDRHITQNAIITDSRFKNVATFKKESFLANVLSSIQMNRPAPKSTEPEKGTWLWTPIPDITSSYRDSIISKAKNNGIRNIYLSIDSYLDIYVMPDGTEKEKKKKDFDEVVKNFIKEANKNNITVDAEAGWRNWAEKDNLYKAFATLDYAIEFNKIYAEKFRGFQYDVEPYLLPSYEKNKKTVLRDFVSLINQAVTELNNSELEFSIAIPEFYDGANRETPKFFYGWKFGYTLDHLLHALERRPGSKIIVMSYRNFSSGENGSIEISKNEISEANKHETKIIIAQETGDVLPSYITFFNTSRPYYNEQTKAIEEAFANNKSYNGLATHYINTFLTLE